MKNPLLKVFFIFSFVVLFSCSNDKSESEDPDVPNVPSEITVTDLSAIEKANCYIVQEPGKYKFAADNQFNLGEGLPVPPQIYPVSASLIWQTEKGSINAVTLSLEEDTPYVEFEVNKAVGNALIAVKDANNEIVWSWHIWMPVDNVYSVIADSGYEVMNLNLGALHNNPGDADSYGMLYQWGRKDPFPAASTLTGDTSTTGATLYDVQENAVAIQNSDWNSVDSNTIAYSISHPTVCLSNYAQYNNSRDWLNAESSDDSLWGNPEGEYRDTSTNTYPNSGKKTCYDPSPAGWRVPPCDTFRHFTVSGGYAWDFADFNISDANDDGIVDVNDFNYGWHFNISINNPLYFPAASRYDGSYAMLMGSMSGLWGNYWSNAPYSAMEGGAFAALSFQIADMYGNYMVTVSPSGAGSRADAYSVRCIRDIK